MPPASIPLQEEHLDEIISAWANAVEDIEVPDIRGSHFVGLPQDGVSGGSTSPSARPLRRRTPRQNRWPQIAALAAGFALLCFGSWKIQQLGGGETLTESQALPVEGWKAVSSHAATRVELQFSVERSVAMPPLVEPGRSGGSYGEDDSLILRVALRGEPSWVYLLEQAPAGAPVVVIHPTSGTGWQLQEGLHALTSRDGEPLAYRPDQATGVTRYLAIATSEPSNAVELATQVLGVGLDRPDLWPRRVRAVDSFVVDWME